MYAVKKGHLYVKDMRFGGDSSYTLYPERAKQFQTVEQAKKDCCGNEHIVYLSLGYERLVNTKKEN